MLQHIPKQVLFKRTLTRQSQRVFAALWVLLLITSVISYTRMGAPLRVHAATTSTLNFQSRLLSATGTLVPDGLYNVEFKLYDVSSGGSALWTETWYDSNGVTAGNDNRVTIKNGYMSVHLGAQTAFPGTINWDQELWITMNIGGATQTATPTWDGEMSPRLKLTALPYAFKAGQAAAVKTADTNAASTNSAAVSIASGNAAGATSNSGNVTIDAGTATQTTGQLLFGTTNASALTLGRAGITTTLQGSVALTGAGTALNVTNNATIGGTLGVTGVSTLSGGLTVGVGTNFINQGSTLFSAAAISDVAAGGNIGTAAATVDAYTTFNVNQTTAGQTLTLPSPTTTTSGRMVFVNNVGSASFTMYGSVIAAGKSNAFIWNGSAWVTTVSLSGSVVNTIGTMDSVSKSADGASISSNAIYLQTADATYPGLVSTGTQTFAGAKTFSGDLTVQNVTLAAGKSLTVTGGNTASRPGSPTEGMVYYDTTTKQLLTYSNGKWQSDSKAATFVVAASDSTQADKDGAQYVADGEDSSGSGIGTLDGDQIQINAALDAAEAAKGGVVFLAAGTYTVDAAIQVPNNVTLAGTGASTLIQLGNFGAGVNVNIIANKDTSTGTRMIVRDVRLDGRRSVNSSGTQYGIYLNGMGAGTGATARDGAKIANVYIANMRSRGLHLNGSSNNIVTGNTWLANASSGIRIDSSSNNNTITGNLSQGNDTHGIYIANSSTNNTVTGNTMQGNATSGIRIESSSNNNVVSGNKMHNNGSSTTNDSIYITGSDENTIVGNDITDTAASTNNYAINIVDNTSDKNYLADNRFSSTAGTSTINDAGTGTVYANQARAENGGQLTVRTADDTAAFQVQNAAGTGLLTVDTTNGQTVLRGVQDTPTLGSELVTSQDFSNATYWTCSTGWTTTTTTAQHNTGNTNTCAATNSNFTVTAGTRYEITYTVTGRTAGVVIPSIGGVSGSGTAADGNYTAGLTASTTGQLTFTPNSAFDGIISAVSVKTSTGTSRPTLIVKDQSGTDSLQLRVSTTNFGLGMNSLQYNTSGINNTALGNSSLLSNTTGYSNTASGYLGLRSNTTGYHNTATGVSSLFSNTTGYQNTAMGANSLFSNTTGYLNDASGYNSLYSNTTGFQNTASGAYAMQSNTSGYLNSAFGAAALQNNTSGYHNVAVGYLSLYSNTSGYYNTAIGYDAGYHDPAQGQFITLNNLQSSTMIGTGSQAYASNVLSLGGQGNMAASVGINTGLPANRLSAESFRYRTGSVTTDGTANIAGTGTTFTSDMVGNIIYIATNSASTAPYRRTITAFTDATHITVDSTVPALTNAEYYINYIGLQMSTTGNVGVGTLNPQSQFEVKGNAGVSSGAVTMTASSGNNTFTTSSSMTLNAGDYIIPTTTTGQARTVSTTATGTSFSIVGTFTGNVTGETFTIYHPTQTTTDSSGNTQFMIQGSTGNVSIGGIFATTTANVKLYVSGGSFLAGSIYTNGNIYNGSSTSNAQITPGTTGTTISRNVADANVALTVTQSNASSTGNILELKNSGGTVAGFSQAGNLFVGTTSAANKVNVNALTTADSLAQVAISTGATTNKGLVVQGVAGQSASIFEVQNSTGADVFKVTNNSTYIGSGADAGRVSVNQNNFFTAPSAAVIKNDSANTTTALTVSTSSSAQSALLIRAASGQSVDILQVQASNTGEKLSGINANGGFFSYGTNNTFAGLATPAFTTASTGSSYYYVMTATNAAGETIASASLGMANNTSTLQWNQVNGATGYKIYRNTSNSFTAGSLLLTTITNGTTVSYTDTGSATGAGLPPTVPTGTGLVVKGWASQSANIFEIQNGNTGLVAAGITSYGRGFFGSTSPVSVGGGNAATLSVTPTATTNVGIVVQGQASQTNNLLQLQDSNGLVNSSFNALGNQLTLGRIASSGTVTQGKIVLADGTTSNYGLTLQSATLTNNQTITFPNETGTVCTTGSVCTGYAPSATNGYVQLAPAAAQTDATTNSSIFLNKTGASGNILQLQKNATDVLTVSNTGSVALQNSADSTAALSVKNLAGTSLLTVDTTNGQTVLRGVQDTPTLGSELVTSQDFSNATYWTCSTGWTTTTTTAQHNTGNTNTCAATNSNFTVTAGTRYEITWTVTGDTSGGYTVAPSIGGTAGTSRAGNGTFTSGITAANTNSLAFTPTSPWNGTISAISVKVSTSIGKPQLTVKDQSGTDAFQLRATSTNIGLGLNSLQYTTSGTYNTALGITSLQANTTGFSNTASGYQSLYANTTGFSNTASGYQSLYANTTGARNTASGSQSLYSNTTGSSSVASGYQSLYANTTGTANTAAGASSLISNSSGSYNVAFGYQASYSTATGSNNTAVGTNAMFKNTTGSYNTSIGSGAGYTGSQIQFTTLRNLQGSTMLGLNSQAFASAILALGGQGADAISVGINTGLPANRLSAESYRYSTGSVTTDGTANIVGTGTTFTSDMVGNVIYIATNSDTTAPYRRTITAFTDATHITVDSTVPALTDAQYYINYIGLQMSTTGNVGINTLSPANKLNVNTLTTADSLAQVAISTGATTNKGLVVQGVASQTANLLEAQNSTGSIIARIQSDGSFVTSTSYTGPLFKGTDSSAADTSNITVRSGAITSGAYNTGNLNLQSGNAISGTTGNVLVDAGSTSGTTGSVLLGTSNASAITLGRSGITTTNAGALTVAQLLTGQLGATISGAAISLNDSSNFNTSINGGTSTGTVTIGNSAAGAIAIQSASTVGITGTTTITGLSAGAGTALTVNNSTSTGSIFVAQDNGSAVFTIADGGAITATQTLTVQGASALTLGLTGTNTGSISFKGATAASGTINLVGQANPTGTRTITLPDETGTVCTTGSVCTGYAAAPASGSYLQQVPATSAANTVTPTANSVVGLTVNGTSGTAATALAVSQPGAAAGVTIASANNTATNGLSFSGTFTNYISAPNFSVTNGGAVSASGLINGLSLTQDYIQFQNGGAGLKFLETSGSGSGTTNSLSVLTGASGGAGASSGDITIGTGNGTGTGTDSGDISIDVGTATGTAGTIYLGTGNTAGITLGRSGITTTNAGALTVSQLLTGNLGATISGATTSINASSNFATNINTGTSTGAVSIGNSAAGAISLQTASTISLTGTTSVTGLSAGSTTALTVNTGATTNTGLVVKRVASQTANLLEAQNESGVPVAYITASGNVVTEGEFITAYGARTADKASGNTSDMSVRSGNAASGNSGNVTIDAGTASGTAGSISLGATNAAAITLGRSGITTTNAGALTVAQLLTGQLGATISGAAISLNDSSNFATNINTGTSTGAVSIGNGAAGAIAIQSASTVGLTGTTTVTGLSAGAGTALTVNNSTSTGNIFVAQDNGSAVFTIADGGNVTLATGKTLRVTGDVTGNRPAATTAGQLYYDTTTNEMLTSNGTKWVSDRTTATKIVAASNSSQAVKDAADYVADGTGDQVEINAALTAAAGGKVYLAEGTYSASATITIPNNTTLAGAGRGTLIQLADIDATDNLIEKTAGQTTGMVVQDLRLDGQKALQTGAITQHGIYMNAVGSGDDASAVPGIAITNVWVDNFETDGIYITGSSNNRIVNTTLTGNGRHGIQLETTYNSTVNSNKAQGNGEHGVTITTGARNTVTSNVLQNNLRGVSLEDADNNTITGNIARESTQAGISLYLADGNTVTGNSSQTNTLEGIVLDTSHNNVISSNKIANNSGATNNDGIKLSASDANTITGNDITDNSATIDNNAIDVSDNTSDNNYLADNRFSSTPGTSTINDAGTGTIFANQPRAENGGQLTIKAPNSTTTFQVQNAAGTNILAVDTSNSRVLVGSAIDTTTATTLSLGTTTATAITLGRTGITTTNAGALTVAQLLTGQLGAIISGATISLNDSSNFNTSINGGTSTGTVTIGNSAAGAIALQSASTVGITGTTTVTGLSAGAGTALTVNNSTSTGNILVAQDNGTAVMTIADGGAATFKNQTDSTSGFAVQDKDGNSRLVVDTTGDRVDVSGAYLRVTGTTTSSVAVQLNQSNFTIQSSAATSQYAVQNQAKFDLLNTGASLSALYGMMNVPTITTTAGTSTTIAAVYGEYLRIDKTSSSVSITGQYGLRVDDGNDVNVTNKYGIYVDEATSATASILFSLYVDGSTGSYFGVKGDGLVDSRSDSTTGFQILNSGTSAVVLNVDTTNTRLGIGTSAPSTSLAFGAGADRTIGVEARSSNAAGRALTISAGAAGTGGSAFTGGLLTLQGGAAAGTGNANGGNVLLTGGAGTGTGVKGLVVIDTPTFTTASTQSCGVDCTITQANVDANAAVIINATAASLTVTMPDPTITTAGRVVYVTAANGSNDFSLSVNGGGTGNVISMRQNTTATMIWNGSDWTAAGASSSTTLQAAYDNTLSSAGGAEIVLNNSATANGLTVRNNASSPIIGGILEAQTSIGSNLFSVNNNATEYATNGGAETAGASASTFPANTWDTTTGGTVDRYTTAGDNIATGAASVRVQTTTTNHGARNRISASLTSGLTYAVSFAVRGATNFNTLQVLYSPDGTTTGTTQCATAQTVTSGIWTRISCTFVASGSITSSNSILIRQTDATARTFYIDNLSVNISASATYAADGSVDNAGAFGTNWTAYGAGSTATRDTSVLYDSSASARGDTTNNADRGIRNNLAITPAVSTQYLVSFYARSGTGAISDLTVRYSRDGGTSFASCVDYNTQAISTSTWTKITCLFTTDSTTATNPDLIFTQATAPGGTRSIYIDALSVTLNTNNANNVQIGGANKGGPATLFTLDRASTAPIADNNDAYLGSMYYDTTTGRIQCYEADGWGACGSAPDNIVNLNPEYAGAVLNGSGIGTMTADLCANGGGLSVNTGLCSSGEAKNFYKWTSPQATQQTYSIYVSYQLPTTFKGFASDETVQLTARVDSTSNAAVTYEMYRSEGGSLSQCGSGETAVTTSANTWQTVGINGNESTGCSFTASSGGAYVIFKINVKANSNANAYVSTLSFTTTGK